MRNRFHYIFLGLTIITSIAVLNGCQPKADQEGIYVMFKGAPKIHRTEVFLNGRTVGKIQDQQTATGAVTKITIQIDPEFEHHAGHHWAFYVEHGRLTAGRLNTSGKPVKAGDRVCGFDSKSSFNWFKVKTLLSNRISTAMRRAEKLFLRFDQSA